MVDREKLQTLIEWMFQSVGDDLMAVVIVDRDGLVMASLLKDNLDEDLLGGMASLVEPVLRRVATEFKSGNFGTGAFDTEQYRLVFCEAGPDAIVVVAAQILASLDNLFPYLYLFTEKIIRIFDGRPVSPVIPDFSHETQVLHGSEEIRRIAIEDGSYVLKTLLTGDGGVGKTTLVSQFVQGSFDDDYKSTIGVSIMKKAVNFDQWDVEVRLTIFDLAGQAQFARVRKTYFAGAKAAFIIYDVTRPETFESVKKWHQECVDVDPEILFLLIANKIDKVDQRQITEAQGKALAHELSIGYLETSALDKDIVDEAFRTLAFLFIRKHKITQSF
jgi:small GTP-binding protein